MFRSLLLCASALALAACVTTSRPATEYLARHTDTNPKPSNFTICHGYGCRLTEQVSLTREWDDVTAPLKVPAATAEEERLHVAQTIAAIELVVGAKTGTSVDIGGTFEGTGEAGQMDCVDESINTTTYLVMLDQAGLLLWHEPRVPVSRGFFINGWPHTTAVLAEIETGKIYVVDSWFHDNGVAPETVALDDWMDGWSPDDLTKTIALTAEPEPSDE
jgi:hypothetical protein